jgi:hypothetical protein
MRFRRQQDSERPPPAEVYTGLRQQVLSLTAEQLGDDELADAPILALLMETGYPEAVATLVAVVDGTSSLYFSNGGGLLGAGDHDAVAQASRGWLETGREFVDELAEIRDVPLPAEGMTQFVAVTPEGLRSAVAPEEELGEGRHGLSPLFYAGQDVITQIRLAEGG